MPTVLTIANIDGEFLGELKATLIDAVVDGAPLFGRVTIDSDLEDVEETRPTTFPSASIVYGTTTERISPTPSSDGTAGRTGTVDVTLRFAAMKSAKSEAVQEALRLKCGAINAIETTPPTKSTFWWGEGQEHERLVWSEPTTQAIKDEGQPFAICDIELSIGYALDSVTSH